MDVQEHLLAILKELDAAKFDACTMQQVVNLRDKTIRRKDAEIDRLKATVARLAMRHAVECN